MKTSKPGKQRDRQIALLLPALFLAATLCAAQLAPGSDNPRTTNTHSTRPAASATTGEVEPASPPPLSPLITSVIRMNQAEVSADVIKAYIDSSTEAAPLTDTDVIALKQNRVPDEIVTALIKQGAKRQQLETQRKNEIVARALSARTARYGGMDPESYDYFQYYYLYPRTLSSAYQRLAPYSANRRFYTYGPVRALPGPGHHGYRPPY